MPRDPVCGMEVKAEGAKRKVEYRGRMYYFCADPCKIEFERNPEKYYFSLRFLEWARKKFSDKPPLR